MTVATGERIFLKLKLIETFMRTTMTQDGLSSFVTLSIGNEIAENLDFIQLIQDCANKKSSKS